QRKQNHANHDRETTIEKSVPMSENQSDLEEAADDSGITVHHESADGTGKQANRTQNTINDTKKPMNRDKSGRLYREQHKKQSKPKTPPFNVLMSANDKRNQQKNRKPIQKTVNKQDAIQKSAVPYHLLDDPVQETAQDHLWMQNQRQLLEKTLKYFNVRAKVVNTTQGPSVTRCEVQAELGVKVSKIKNISDDIKLNMAAKDIRIAAPIPGKSTISIEMPKQHARTVTLQEIFEKQRFQTSASPFTIGLALSI